jgi:PAT family acetyl-CoA transporter-like MFS transporter 1
MFLTTAIVLAIFKREKKLTHKRLSIWETYKTIGRIVMIKPVQLLMLFLFSFKMGYAEKGVPILKIIRNGFSKDFVSLFIYTPLAPVNVIWPFFISKYTNGLNPLRVFFAAYPVR